MSIRQVEMNHFKSRFEVCKLRQVVYTHHMMLFKCPIHIHRFFKKTMGMMGSRLIFAVPSPVKLALGNIQWVSMGGVQAYT